MSSITPTELKAKIDNNDSFQLVDVREDYEFETFNIGGINIPLNQVFTSLDCTAKDKPIIFCCNSGKKSKAIVHTVKRKLNITEVFSLQGGLEAFVAE